MPPSSSSAIKCRGRGSVGLWVFVGWCPRWETAEPSIFIDRLAHAPASPALRGMYYLDALEALTCSVIAPVAIYKPTNSSEAVLTFSSREDASLFFLCHFVQRKGLCPALGACRVFPGFRPVELGATARARAMFFRQCSCPLPAPSPHGPQDATTTITTTNGNSSLDLEEFDLEAQLVSIRHMERILARKGGHSGGGAGCPPTGKAIKTLSLFPIFSSSCVHRNKINKQINKKKSIVQIAAVKWESENI